MFPITEEEIAKFVEEKRPSLKGKNYHIEFWHENNVRTDICQQHADDAMARKELLQVHQSHKHIQGNGLQMRLAARHWVSAEWTAYKRKKLQAD